MPNFEQLLTPPPLRWPEKGDRLLRAAGDWESGASFTDSAFARQVYLWDGFMEAGHALVAAAKDNRPERETLIYPILFNYRHALELAMKWVVEQYGRFASPPQEVFQNHNLWQLWKACRAVIEDVGGPTDEEVPAIASVEQLVKDFHDVDGSAQAFRYHTNRNGELISLPAGAIDVANIGDVMTGVANFFSGVDGQLDANTSAAP